MPFTVNDPGHVAEHNRIAQALPPGFVPASTDSPALTGTPTAPTPAVGDSSGSIATTAFVTDGFVSQVQLSGVRPGNRVAYLGDSITQAGWQNSTNFQSDSYPLYAMLTSGCRLVTVANAGLSGDTSGGALSRFDSQVAPFAPTAVVILLGTNDIGLGYAMSTWTANIEAIVAKTRGCGAVPVLCTIPPNNDSTRHAMINTWNAWLRRYAASQGLTIINFYKLLADPTNGNYSSTYVTDGTHPNTAGYLAMGNLVSSVLSPLAPNWQPYVSQDNTDALNVLTSTNSVMLTDANSDGVPDGWFAYGGSSGYAHALVTDSQVVGKMAQITQTANASIRSIQKGLSGVSVGDQIAISGIVTSDGGVAVHAKTTFVGASSSADASSFTNPVTRGWFYQEFTIPASTTSVTLDLIAGAGTGVVAFGQVTAINLTTNQLLLS